MSFTIPRQLNNQDPFQASIDAVNASIATISGVTTAATSANTPSTVVSRDGAGATSIGAISTNTLSSIGATMDIASNSTTVNVACGAGVQTVNMGTNGGGATTINIGGSGDTVNVAGTLTYINTTNTQITDKIITLNKGGAALSAGLSGLEFEEAGSATGAYMRIASTRDKVELKAPTGSTITLNQSLATTDTPSFNALAKAVMDTK